jgi:hypothetical protein
LTLKSTHNAIKLSSYKGYAHSRILHIASEKSHNGVFKKIYK